MRKYIALLVFSFCVAMVCAQTDQACACCSENHFAFDFWIGTWSVTDTKGKIVGENTITKAQDGCIVQENWKGASGVTGTSINFFNTKTKQWEQLWVDNSGSHLKLKGNRIGNQMILSSDEFMHTDGKKYVNRITWTLNEDGTVRQLWEVLQNEKVVSTAFDGLYKNQKP